MFKSISVIRQCEAEWKKKNNELKLVEVGKDKIDKEFYGETHDVLHDAIFVSLSNSQSTKRGNYYQAVLRTLCKNFDHLHLFYGNILPDEKSVSEKYKAKSCNIYIPKELTWVINEIETDIKENKYSLRKESDIASIFKKLYQETKMFKGLYRKKKYNPDDYTNYSTELNLGIYDSNLDEYFLYDVQSNGCEKTKGKKSFMYEAFLKYCSIVFNNDIPFEKLHVSYVLVLNCTEVKLSNKNGGYVDLDMFFERHNLSIDKNFLKEIFVEIPCTRDEELHKLTDRIIRVYHENPDCENKASSNYKDPKMFAVAYKSLYSSR